MKLSVSIATVFATALGISSLSTAVGAADLGEQCPYAEVIFARGTGELYGVGETGQAFIDAVRSRLNEFTVNQYPVNFPSVPDFVKSSIGVRDIRDRVRFLHDTCPTTKVVLGGFSRGAELTALATADMPPTAPQLLDAAPLSPELSGTIAAVVLMGRPTGRFLRSIPVAPEVTSGALYASRTLDVCAPLDPVCSDGIDETIHRSYPYNGITVSAANFAAHALIGQ